jgi:hypothetical protein
MKLFVAFHYHDDDKWIRDFALPIIRSLDIKTITGEDIHGDIIVQEVPELIKKSDCMISFITKSWIDHPWVRDELITARAIKIPALEIRESTVQGQNGINDGRQILLFNINNKEKLLVDLAQILSKWKKKYETKTLVILPDEIMQLARPHMRIKGSLKCMYQFKDGNEETEEYEAQLFKLPDSLGVDIKNIPSETALIQLTIEGPGFSWYCGYQPFNLIPINLKRN